MTQTRPAPDDLADDPLNRAIDELRGALHQDKPPETVPGPRNSDMIMNIPVEVQIVLGTTEMPVSELMALSKGSTVALDRRIGEPVDVVVNGRRIARGEIIVLEHDSSRFGIRLTEIIAAPRPA